MAARARALNRTSALVPRPTQSVGRVPKKISEGTGAAGVSGRPASAVRTCSSAQTRHASLRIEEREYQQCRGAERSSGGSPQAAARNRRGSGSSRAQTGGDQKTLTCFQLVTSSSLVLRVGGIGATRRRGTQRTTRPGLESASHEACLSLELGIAFAGTGEAHADHGYRECHARFLLRWGRVFRSR